ncbi:MAG: methionine adenosyltransferase [Candidatus Borkfalkiaceae bacterium]|nr:methionine adenosyltransferase [Clostridia bacterium]MDY6223693.1 methionine adenosyltransferase [Christensenellaceae bacterium]
MKKFFTSESVTEGHPDKVCDQIADGILDEILKQDSKARAAIECCAAYDGLLIMGEVTTSAKVDYEACARNIIKKIGYTFGSFAYDTCKITVSVHGQSADIALGVNASAEKKSGEETDEAATLGAGDQGMMFGYACRETEELMPLPVMLAHKLAMRLAKVRKDGTLAYLRPDGKTQVTVEYNGNTPVRVDAVVVSAQHDESVSQETLRSDIKKYVVDEIVSAYTDENTKYFINPTGRFEIGGPEGDSGLTGRKIIVDTYGGMCAHGGGSFSGKDPTKVDRSATYFCRYVAKNLVAANLAEKAEIQVAYAIGVANPVSVFVDTFGTGKLPDDELAKIIVKEFDFRPYAIIKTLGLRAPVYAQTAAYGHFGRNGFSWERTDRTCDLAKYL